MNNLPSAFDNGLHSSARFMPMASADFGAESGSYFLKSRPISPPEPYQVAPDPHQKKRKKKRTGAQVVETAQDAAQVPAEVPAEVPAQVRTAPSATAASCAQGIRWETLPTCVLSTVTGVWTDVTQGREDLTTVVTKENRLTYLGILFLLLFFVYRILRK
jgi:hypothetical protein